MKWLKLLLAVEPSTLPTVNDKLRHDKLLLKSDSEIDLEHFSKSKIENIFYEEL